MSVDFSPDGTKVVSGLSSGTIKVWKLVPWSRRDHQLFDLTTHRSVVLILWLLNACKMPFPDDVVDLIIKACLA